MYKGGRTCEELKEYCQGLAFRKTVIASEKAQCRLDLVFCFVHGIITDEEELAVGSTDPFAKKFHYLVTVSLTPKKLQEY